MKVKIFSDSNLESLERAVNDWLSINDHHQVVRVIQSESMSADGKKSVTITLVYH